MSRTARRADRRACAVARKIPFDNPDVLLYVRIGYVASQLLTLGVYYYMSVKVRAPLRPLLRFAADGVRCMCVCVVQIKAKNDQTVLKYGACSVLLARPPCARC